jgi:hypothetical protein
MTIQKSNEKELRRDALAKQCGACVPKDRIDRYLSFQDLEQRVSFIKEEMQKNRTAGLELLYIALSDDELPLLYREEALDLLVKALDENPNYDTKQEVSQNAQALQRICDRIKKEN